MKKKSFLAALMALVMLCTVFSCGITAAAADNTVAYGVDAYNYVKYLDENLRARRAGTEQETKAAAYITGELESFGYEVIKQPFSYTSTGATVNSQNLIVTKPGRSEKQIIVGAHYDSVNTAGVDDNGSGTSVTLETAKRMFHVSTPYTIKFIFFGAEEAGLRGSKAYAGSMSEEEIANTVLMINLDSILAGTYRYVYGGVVNGETGAVDQAWGVYQAKALADELELGIRLNDTQLNSLQTPTTGNWSDHASFKDIGLPYVYFEAANWELPDDPAHPERGSTGAYETESGEVMHVSGRDDLTFIENEWGTRAKDTLAAYAELLPAMLMRVSPDGLLADKTELSAKVEAAEAVDTSKYTDASVTAFKIALADAKKVLADDTILAADQQKVDLAAKALAAAQNALREDKGPVIEMIEHIFKEVFVRVAKIILHILLKIIF